MSNDAANAGAKVVIHHRGFQAASSSDASVSDIQQAHAKAATDTNVVSRATR